MTAWIAVIGAILSCIIGVWKLFGRRAATKRKIMQEAQKDLDNAHKNKDASSILDAYNKSGRM